MWDWGRDQLIRCGDWIEHVGNNSTTWQRMAGYDTNTWHNLISAMAWGITFAVLFFVPIKRTREWTPLAVGLTTISGILALLLLTTVTNVLWPSLRLEGLLRYLFRDVGTVVNVLIVWKVFWPDTRRKG